MVRLAWECVSLTSSICNTGNWLEKQTSGMGPAIYGSVSCGGRSQPLCPMRIWVKCHLPFKNHFLSFSLTRVKTEMSSVKWEQARGWKKRQGWGSSWQRHWGNHQDSSHSWTCTEALGSPPGVCSRHYVERVAATAPQAPASCSYMHFLNCHHDHTEQALLPYELGACPRRSLASPSPASFIGSQCKFFQDNFYLFFLQTHCIKCTSIPGQQSCLSFPHSPPAAG